MRIAIVGAGPAGFYTAGHLLESGPNIAVDLLERLPTPWGLVRLGVAPDHPNIKAVSRVFDRIAASERFRFLGNVEVGRDLSPAELARCYDAVVYAIGAQADRRLGIPGEDLPGSLPATSFVAWYNGHPDAAELDPDLSCETALVVGNGNVALDVARILATDPAVLARTDIADHALRALAASAVREIVVLGRRGPAEASFTNPELRELGELAGVAVVVDPADLDIAEPSDTLARRNLDTLHGFTRRRPPAAARTLRLRFCASPIALCGDGGVVSARIVRNRLAAGSDGRVVAVPTGETETVHCGLVLRSIGYRGVPLAGLPFDAQTGTIPNERGRIRPGVYCTGWIKRGPSGVIGTNKKDAAETVEQLLDDASSGLLPAPLETSEAAPDALLAARGVAVVDGEGWRRIDAAERAAGMTTGRPRVKLVHWDELLATALPTGATAGAYRVYRSDER